MQEATLAIETTILNVIGICCSFHNMVHFHFTLSLRAHQSETWIFVSHSGVFKLNLRALDFS
jgi:hypothetical protein